MSVTHEDMNIWVILLQSCLDCNRQVVGVFNHEPTEEDIRKVKRKMTFTTCSTLHIIQVEVNGECKEFKINDW